MMRSVANYPSFSGLDILLDELDMSVSPKDLNPHIL